MATLNVNKAKTTGTISIPLTTTKPIARSFSFCYNGTTYYSPLVHSGEYLDSGVKVRYNGTNYALAKQIYDPVTYDSSGQTWTKIGSPKLYSRGCLELDGNSYLVRDSTTPLTKEGYFYFECTIIPTSLGSANQIIFYLLSTTSTSTNVIG